MTAFLRPPLGVPASLRGLHLLRHYARPACVRSPRPADTRASLPNLCFIASRLGQLLDIGIHITPRASFFYARMAVFSARERLHARLLITVVDGNGY